jgi:hypothetical protein
LTTLYIIDIIYRMIQEEGLLFWKVCVWVFVKKENYMNVFLNLNCYRATTVRTSSANSIRFLFLGLEVERSLNKTGEYT